MSKLRLGIIGCGEITKFMLLFAKLNHNIQIVGCADIIFGKAQKYAKHFNGAKAFADYKEMVQSLKMDAIYIAVPHYLHYPVMKELIPLGIHLFCEKPITTNLEDANKIIELAKKHKVKVGINYHFRYDNGCYRMAMASRNGNLGQLYYGIANIPWSRNDKYFLDSKWHCSQEQAGGGTLITQGSHALDILLWAFGAKPVRAMGVIKKTKFTSVQVEDLCMGSVELENGALLQITSSMVAEPEQPLTISIYGSEGTAVYTGKEVFSKVNFLKAQVPAYKMDIKGIHALGRSLEAFRKWVVDDTPYSNQGENAIPVLATVLAIYRSGETGKSEQILL